MFILIVVLFVLDNSPGSPIKHSSRKVNDYIEHRLNEMRANQEGNLASRVLVKVIFGTARDSDTGH
ncbi:hypothetical protein [Photobacterium sp. DNB22_13_2]